jgi:ubiquinone biosynthesis protein COQ4
MTLITADPDDIRTIRSDRIRPLEALRAFRRLVRDKEDTAQVFRIMQALSGRSVTRGYQRMLASMEGGRQAFLGEELAHRLDDPVWLARFGPGTVGAGYRAFRETRGFTADGLAAVEREVLPYIDAPHPVFWYSRRLRDIHDVWHVLTGYGTDALGEACVVAFSYGQTRNLGFAFIGWGAAREIQREARTVPARRAVFQAWRNGKAARWLPGLDYEALFDQPLEDARARLGIRPPSVYQSVPAAVRAELRLRG